jgi:hypothetical protein
MGSLDMGSVLVIACIAGVLFLVVCAFKLAQLGNDKADLSIAILSHCGQGWDAEIAALKTRVKSLEDSAMRAKTRDADKAQVRIAKVA